MNYLTSPKGCNGWNSSSCTQQLTPSALLAWLRSWVALVGMTCLTDYCQQHVNESVTRSRTPGVTKDKFDLYFSSVNRFEFLIHRFNLTRMNRILISLKKLFSRHGLLFSIPDSVVFLPRKLTIPTNMGSDFYFKDRESSIPSFPARLYAFRAGHTFGVTLEACEIGRFPWQGRCSSWVFSHRAFLLFLFLPVTLGLHPRLCVCQQSQGETSDPLSVPAICGSWFNLLLVRWCRVLAHSEFVYLTILKFTFFFFHFQSKPAQFACGETHWNL